MSSGWDKQNTFALSFITVCNNPGEARTQLVSSFCNVCEKPVYRVVPARRQTSFIPVEGERPWICFTKYNT
jgi:hypothetical protein